MEESPSTSETDTHPTEPGPDLPRSASLQGSHGPCPLAQTYNLSSQ